MSDTYTKLFASITASTIWQEPAGTRLTWITMLAMAHQDGCVYASVPGLAHHANVSIADVEVALKCFTSPDSYSRTKDNDGRRVEEIDGGWRLLNHAKFRAVRSAEERREYWRDYKRKAREAQCDPPHEVPESCPQMSTLSTEVTPPAPTPTQKEKKEQKKKHAREARAHLLALPPEFGISDSVRKWAQGKGHGQLEAHLEAFVETAKARAYVYADWDSAFKKAVREDWAKLRNGEANGNRTFSRKLSAVERVEAACEADRQREASERFALSANG